MASRIFVELITDRSVVPVQAHIAARTAALELRRVTGETVTIVSVDLEDFDTLTHVEEVHQSPDARTRKVVPTIRPKEFQQVTIERSMDPQDVVVPVVTEPEVVSDPAEPEVEA